MIGIDIGGANLKVVDGDKVSIHYCPLWKGALISDTLKIYSKEKEAAVVMSGELADCFASKMDGITFIVEAVRKVFPDAIFYGTDGMFHKNPCIELAAANWLVMADILKFRYPDGLLIDMGSTTTDLIPLNAFDEMKDQTDYSRLTKNLLLYYGLLRTPVSSLLRAVSINGKKIRLSTEYFACAGDAHLINSLISPKDYTTPAPDNGGKTREECLQRIARMVCADLSDIGTHIAEFIAEAYIMEEKIEILDAVRDLLHKYGCKRVLTVGIGSGFISSLTGGENLREIFGEISDAMPAYAVREAALRTG